MNKLFERKLRMLERKSIKESLIEIHLNTINIHGTETPVIVPIDRIRINKERVFCESMIRPDQLNCNYQEGEDIVFFNNINVIGNESNIAASLVAEEDDFEIDFEKIEAPIIILSVKFTTKYAKAIQKKFPCDRKDEFIYAIYDEEDESDKVVFL